MWDCGREKGKGKEMRKKKVVTLYSENRHMYQKSHNYIFIIIGG